MLQEKNSHKFRPMWNFNQLGQGFKMILLSLGQRKSVNFCHLNLFCLALVIVVSLGDAAQNETDTSAAYFHPWRGTYLTLPHHFKAASISTWAQELKYWTDPIWLNVCDQMGDLTWNGHLNWNNGSSMLILESWVFKPAAVNKIFQTGEFQWS